MNFNYKDLSQYRTPAHILLIIGGLNLGLMGLFNFNLLLGILGAFLGRLLFIAIGAAAGYMCYTYYQEKFKPSV